MISISESRPYLANIFVIPLFDDQKFYDPPPPPRATILKKHVTPNARSAENEYAFWGLFQ